MGELSKAQQVYEILFGQATEKTLKTAIYHQLAMMKGEQGEYIEAIAYCEKSMEIEKNQIFFQRSEFDAFLHRHW